MPLHRVRVTLTNFPGAPGYAAHYFSTSVTDMTALKTFWTSLVNYFAAGTTFTLPSSGDIINETDGKITGGWSGSGGGTAGSGGTAANYSGSSGAVVEWQSNAIVNGRRPLGKTYVVPLKSTYYDTQGSLDITTCVTPITTAATTLLAAYTDGLKVWSRPYTPPTDGKPHPAARVGSYGTAIAARVPDLAVTMRSRRT